MVFSISDGNEVQENVGKINYRDEMLNDRDVSLKRIQLLKGMIRSVFIATVAIILAGSAYGTTYYLDANSGSDSNSGTSASNAWKSISKARDSVAPGDVVKLRDGNYGSVTFSDGDTYGTSWSSPISYVAEAGHRPVLNSLTVTWPKSSSSPDVPLYGIARYLIIDGITVDKSWHKSMAWAVVDLHLASNVKLLNLELIGYMPPARSDGRRYTSDGLTQKGICIGRADMPSGKGQLYDITIEGCDIHDITTGIDIMKRWKKDSSGSSKLVFRNNHVHHLSGSAIKIYTGNGNGTILIEGNHLHDQVGVRVVGDNDWQHGSGISIRSRNMTVRYNRIHDCGTTRGIYTYHSVFDDANSGGGYYNMIFENNLLYDIKNPFIFELEDMGPNVRVCNNTIIGHNDGKSNASYFETAFWIKNAGWGQDGSTFDFYNNVFMGKVDMTSSVAGMNCKGNVFYYLNVGGDSKSESDYPGNRFAITSSNTQESSYFKESFFEGSDLFDKWCAGLSPFDSPCEWKHGIDLGDSFQLASTSPAVGFADAANSTGIDLLGNARDSDPDSGCYEHNGVPIDDTTPPEVVSVEASEESIAINFNEAVDAAYAEDIGKYHIGDGIEVLSVVLSDDLKKVILTTSPHQADTEYNIIVYGICDLAGNEMTPKIIAYSSDSGLVGCWFFNEGTGQICEDQSGNGNTAILLNGAGWAADDLDAMLSVDGADVDQAAEVGTNGWDVDSGTIAVWVAAVSFSDTSQYIFSHINSNSWSDRLQLYTDDVDGYLDLGIGDDHSKHLGIVKLETDQWYHIALTWDGVNYAVYVDGSLKANGSYSGLQTFGTVADIGNNGIVATRDKSFDGYIDDVHVYRSALSASKIASMALIDQPPVLEVIGDKVCNENSLLSFTVNAVDPDGGVLVYTAHQLPAGAVLSGNVFSWTPNYDQAGVYDITFNVTDGGNQDSQTVRITVNNVNRVPVVGPLADKIAKEGEAIIFPVRFYDPDGDVVTCYADNIPSGATFTGRWFLWTPQIGQAGEYVVSLVASDGIDEVVRTVLITVLPVDTQAQQVIIIDNGDAGTSQTGSWSNSSAPDYYGTTSLYSRYGAAYLYETPLNGSTNVYLWWTVGSTRSTSVPVDIYDGSTLLDTIYINQQISGGKWNLIGTYDFTGFARVVIRAEGGSSTCADAIKLEVTSDDSGDTDSATEPVDERVEVVVDNNEEGTSVTGSWKKSSASDSYGTKSVYSRYGSTYSFEASVSDKYEVQMWWTEWSTRSTAVPVEIYDGSALIDTVYINQQSDGGKWNVLGTYEFSGQATVKIIAEGKISTCADAVKYLPL